MPPPKSEMLKVPSDRQKKGSGEGEIDLIKMHPVLDGQVVGRAVG